MKKYIIIEKDVDTEKCIRTIADSFDDMRFLGTAKNQDEALNLIFKNAPDIIFLGIDNVIDDLLDFLLDVNKHSIKDPPLLHYLPQKRVLTRLINMIFLIIS
ncbi:hypothetical protein [Sinomicrobium sp. M5D2P9]